ncbi:MAG: nickel pincer cofactor biosynthesis protein LarC [Acidimicrobiales bacterium]
MTFAWFNPFAGIAGDMALGALIDVGADANAVEDACRQLGYPGWRMHHDRVDRCGLQATHVRVEVDEQHHHRRAGEIIDTIAGSGLAERAVERAVRIFSLLAKVEGALHGVAPHDVTFHEIGAVDSIIDIVGVAVALELLQVDRVGCAPVAVGVGRIQAAHGLLPNPAPAVMRVLEGFAVVGLDVPMELTTPTGAAVIAALAEHAGAIPSGMVLASGYGAGTRNPPDRPNVVQVVLGQPRDQPHTGGQYEDVVRLDVNLDDATGETVGYVLERLLASGALDAWASAATMKKSRPGVVVSALCHPGRREALSEILLRESGSLGVRWSIQQRWAADRHTVTVTVGDRTVRVKVGPYRVKAEYDDVAAVARDQDRPLRAVAQQAEALARAQLASDRPAPDQTSTPAATGAAEGARLDSLDHNDR